MQLQSPSRPWIGADRVAPSEAPPGGLSPRAVPQFVSLGWDDCGEAAGIAWSLEVYARLGGKGSYFVTSSHGLTEVYRRIHREGHELGNHTVTHATSRGADAARWREEIAGCHRYLTEIVGVPAGELRGFRAPFLQYNDATLAALEALGFHYDCSIEEGFERRQDGTSFYWPYTLHGRSPGHTAQLPWNHEMQEIEPHPGLWELPAYAVVVPPDEACARYGLAPGFRMRMKAAQRWFSVQTGSITGFDYNLWADPSVGGFAMTRQELVATLKHTLALRLRGNRAPLLFGTHPDYYAASWDGNAPRASLAERRAAIEEFLEHAAGVPEVRLTSHGAVLDWIRAPSPLWA
jgi:hypothetical protein